MENKDQNNLFNAPMLIFIVISTQVGVGVAGFQRIIFQEAKQDSWISIVIAGITINLIIWVIVRTVQAYDGKDLFEIHHHVFGKIIGRIFNIIFCIYLLSAYLVIVLDYILIVRVWVFPTLQNWIIGLLLLFLTIYGLLGGLRLIVGIAFTVFFSTIWMLFLLLEPVNYIDVRNLLPVFEASPKQLIIGTYRMTLTVLGFEILYFVLPYVKEKNKSMWFAQIGAVVTTLIYIIVMVISIAYFSPKQLDRTVWATLTMFKIVRFPNLERFEIVAVSMWMIVILPNLLIYMWSAIKGLKRVFTFSTRKAIYLTFPIIFMGILSFTTTEEIIMITDKVSHLGFALAFVYPLFLGMITLLKIRYKEKVVKK
ncbi:GerAB/ArcD/ProY family transporter [Bacillus carboniphilus]|uniref:GerAB/ArcD/ProY family transporter n=1 Tax=Bacillus carboniphilus TaxID=86663 RepID=A0ABY9JXB8_9BACI|nr:GerAB/ArcD/ProY family transporter [Bacillus carboniphilus]WLR43157.1 GerAB/ArcD/ProY family transporter [Bacillus carboniphilus]